MHPLIPIHVVTASVALFAGFGALAFRKGSVWHARTGTWFFGSMLAMAITGAIIALAMPERGTATVGLLSCYLVSTSWLAARRRDGVAGNLERAGLAVALACMASFLAIGLLGVADPDGRLDRLPAGVHFPFAAVAALAAALDLSFIRRGRLTGAQRIARHLWRMSAALLIAAMSFFLGQQGNMPAAVRGSPLLYLPPLAVLASMVFWILRVRFSKALPRPRPRAAAAPPARLAPENA